MKNEKTALIDVCDVSVDLHNETIKAAELDLNEEQIKSWDLFSVINEDECERVLNLFNNPEFWRHLPPVPGVHEGVEGLRSQGYRIQWVTSPWHSCKNWEGIRRIWLEEQGLVKDMIKDVTFTTEKYMIAGDIFIDDRPKHVKLWQAKHRNKQAWLFDSIFNRHFSWKRRGVWSPEGIVQV